MGILNKFVNLVDKTKTDAIGTAVSLLNEKYPWLIELAKGNIYITENQITKAVNEKISNMEKTGIEKITVFCKNEKICLELQTSKYGTKQDISVPLTLQDFEISSDRQNAVLILPENVQLLSGNALSFVLQGIIRSIAEGILQDDKKLNAIFEKETDGLITIDGNKATIHFNKIPEIKQALDFKIPKIGIGVFDIVKLTPCTVEDGRLFIEVHKLSLSKRIIEESAKSIIDRLGTITG
jgi:hypothetical protein